MTMREKMAWAMVNTAQIDADSDLRPFISNIEAVVDAALDALMEPNEEMADAGNEFRRANESREGLFSLTEAFTAMIRAAKDGK